MTHGPFAPRRAAAAKPFGKKRSFRGKTRCLFLADSPELRTDFNHVADTIRLENAIFTQTLRRRARADAGFFHVDPAAADANDYIVYNKATGVLSYEMMARLACGDRVCLPAETSRCWPLTISR